MSKKHRRNRALVEDSDSDEDEAEADGVGKGIATGRFTGVGRNGTVDSNFESPS